MARNFAEALAEQIQMKGLTPYRLSQLSGIGHPMISKLLAGSSQPGWETVVKIALALEVDVGVFVTPDIALPPMAEPGKPGRPKTSNMEQPEEKQPAKKGSVKK